MLIKSFKSSINFYSCLLNFSSGFLTFSICYSIFRPTMFSVRIQCSYEMFFNGSKRMSKASKSWWSTNYWNITKCSQFARGKLSSFCSSLYVWYHHFRASFTSHHYVTHLLIYQIYKELNWKVLIYNHYIIF